MQDFIFYCEKGKYDTVKEQLRKKKVDVNMTDGYPRVSLCNLVTCNLSAIIMFTLILYRIGLLSCGLVMRGIMKLLSS